MRICEATLESAAPYSQSRHYETPKLPKENSADYEERTWRERMHADENGDVYVPPMCFKNALSEIAKFLSMQIPGKGKATYTKHFEAGVLVMDAVPLGVKKDEVPGEWLFVPSDGRRGGGSRVRKCFPLIKTWKAVVRFYILDETITQDVFEQHLREAGNFIGIGRFRPRNNGYYGRFRIASPLKWSTQN
jgi:hypothetical protein